MPQDVNGVNTCARLGWMSTVSDQPTAGDRNRASYHHGDLRNALVAGGVELARQGGVPAVVLTRLARSLGVSPAAAYRHFPRGHEELLEAVGARAREELAQQMRAGIAAAPAPADPVLAAMLRFRATGRAYVDFALEQPGLFQLACLRDHDLAHDGGVAALLNGQLDELVALGRLPAARRPRSEVAAWAAVHGLALLLTSGPLAMLDPAERDAVIERTLEVVGCGI